MSFFSDHLSWKKYSVPVFRHFIFYNLTNLLRIDTSLVQFCYGHRSYAMIRTNLTQTSFR